MSPNQERDQGSSLGTVIIFTEQMEELARFYQEGLGLREFQRSPRHMGVQLGEVYFGFDQVEQVEGKPPAGATLWFTVDDLQATFDRLLGLGARSRYPPTRKPWGSLLAAVYDLDGNILGLAQRVGES